MSQLDMISCHCPAGKPVFDIHDPTEIRYLFQLRLGLSHLRSHKKCYGFEDTQLTFVCVRVA